ncbi:MAG: hypothetical protein HRT70_03645 [Flavobacteriaceae bacterium]|nr:hypothetical protein [Flavobacteriaceae bacterium]
MVLETYIRDLMLRYDCVIVPDFGGFITNRISAAIDQKSHTFYPPTKQLGFNHHLTHNDGLLANYIATEENISFEQATHKIVETVIRWNQNVKTNTLLLDKIGAFHLNEKNQLIFNPVITENYLLSSFGLASFEAPTITRKDTKSVPLRSEKTKTRAIPSLVKYASAAAVALIVSYAAWTESQNKQDQLNLAKQEERINQKIQAATFVIDTPLPTIELSVGREVARPFHVVAGAFQFKENAHKKVKELKRKGYDAYILGQNRWGLTQVAYASFYKKTNAFQSLANIRKSDSKDAWLLIKKFY